MTDEPNETVAPSILEEDPKAVSLHKRLKANIENDPVKAGMKLRVTGKIEEGPVEDSYIQGFDTQVYLDDKPLRCSELIIHARGGSAPTTVTITFVPAELEVELDGRVYLLGKRLPESTPLPLNFPPQETEEDYERWREICKDAREAGFLEEHKPPF